MTSQQMYEKMVDRVKYLQEHISFMELEKVVGPEAKGPCSIYLGDRLNTILWGGCSEKFFKAFSRLQPVLDIHGASQLVYVIDGGFLKLPVAKRPREDRDYKKPHWLPVCFSLKKGIKVEGFELRVSPISG